MSEYNHYISGFFANRDDAESTFSILVERGLPRDRLQIFKTDTPSPDPAPKDDSNAVLKDVLVDGTIGAAVGTGIVMGAFNGILVAWLGLPSIVVTLATMVTWNEMLRLWQQGRLLPLLVLLLLLLV